VSYRKNQSGSTILTLILIILVLVVVALIGYGIWRKHHNKPVTTVVMKPATKAKTTPTTTQSTTATTPTVSYLDIKELGIKFPIPTSVSDLTYTWANNEATLHSQAWLQYMQANDPSCVTPPVDSTSPPEDWAGYVVLDDGSGGSGPGNSVVVDGKTYDYIGHEQGCDVESVSQRAIANDQAIEATFKQATAD
jgi:hypothetical protein